MKIGFFSLASMSFSGGYEQQIIRLAREFAAHGHQVKIITLSSQATRRLAVFLSFLYFKPRLSFPDVNDETPSELDGSGCEIVFFSSFSQLRIELDKCDILYAKNEILDCIILSIVNFRSNKPVIGGLHTVLQYSMANNIYVKLHNLVYHHKWYWRLSDRVYSIMHCINSRQVGEVRHYLPHKKLYYLPNFLPYPAKVMKVENDKTFRVIYAGRLTEEKGIDLLLQIISDVTSNISSGKRFRFIICGTGSWEKTVKETARRNNQIEYAGQVPQQSMQKYYRRADLLCVTSRGEALPVSVLEAMSYGVPVLGFNIDGLNDIIKSAKTGVLVELGDIESFKKELFRLSEIKFKRKKDFMSMCRASREFVRNNFTPEVLYPKYEKMFASPFDRL